jgi:hypothetical protein
LFDETSLYLSCVVFIVKQQKKGCQDFIAAGAASHP